MDERPIIRSLLDTDLYKLTMLQVIWKHRRDVPVKYQHINRNPKFRMRDCVREEDFRAELDNVQSLRFDADEIAYLDSIVIGGRKILEKAFLDELADYRLADYHLRPSGSGYDLSFEGPWYDIELWETFSLSISQELCTLAKIKESGVSMERILDEGRRVRASKMRELNGLWRKITEFGTRRRFSRVWQRECLQEAKANGLTTTSNIQLAKELGLDPKGTFAHSMFQVLYGVFYDTDNPALSAHTEVLRVWWEEYGEALSVALTDTYGSEFFFRNFTEEQVRNWIGYRLDSGDLLAQGEKHLRFIEDAGVDPITKLLFPSDGLTPGKIRSFEDRFSEKVITGYGMGTNFVFDFGVLPLLPEPIVTKVVEANGHPTPKLSNNIPKATGDPDEIERCKALVGYTSTYNEPVKY